MTHVNEYALISVFLIFNDALRLRYLKIIIFYPYIRPYKVCIRKRLTYRAIILFAARMCNNYGSKNAQIRSLPMLKTVSVLHEYGIRHA